MSINSNNHSLNISSWTRQFDSFGEQAYNTMQDFLSQSEETGTLDTKKFIGLLKELEKQILNVHIVEGKGLAGIQAMKGSLDTKNEELMFNSMQIASMLSIRHFPALRRQIHHILKSLASNKPFEKGCYSDNQEQETLASIFVNFQLFSKFLYGREKRI